MGVPGRHPALGERCSGVAEVPAWCKDGGMDAAETLGVPAHPGGLLVDRPELTVGLLRATFHPVEGVPYDDAVARTAG
jgi:hypothetical protein